MFYDIHEFPDRVTQGEDGVYRWKYRMNPRRNRHALIIMGEVFLIMAILSTVGLLIVGPPSRDMSIWSMPLMVDALFLGMFLLIAGMLRYYKEADVEMTQDELLDNLMIEDRTIPLPVWEPYPTAEGLVFTYQQYEIASYAEGMPSFTVPYEEIQPYLTEEFRQLL